MNSTTSVQNLLKNEDPANLPTDVVSALIYTGLENARRNSTHGEPVPVKSVFTPQFLKGVKLLKNYGELRTWFFSNPMLTAVLVVGATSENPELHPFAKVSRWYRKQPWWGVWEQAYLQRPVTEETIDYITSVILPTWPYPYEGKEFLAGIVYTIKEGEGATCIPYNVQTYINLAVAGRFLGTVLPRIARGNKNLYNKRLLRNKAYSHWRWIQNANWLIPQEEEGIYNALTPGQKMMLWTLFFSEHPTEGSFFSAMNTVAAL